MLLPDPLTICRGGAFVTFGGATFFSKTDIVFDWGITTERVKSDVYGEMQPFRTKVAPSLKLTLIGDIANLSVLYPFAAKLVGSSIFSSGSNVLTITPTDTTQKVVKFYQGAISKEPSLTLGPTTQALGEVTFRFRPATGLPLTNTAAWFEEDNNTWDGTGFDVADILIQSYAGSWLSTGTYTLTYGANTTASLLYNASHSDVSTALNAIASITSAGGVTVLGDYQNGFVVTFSSNGVRTNISGTFTGMPGGTSLKQVIGTAGTSGAAQVVTLTLEPWAIFSSEDTMKIEPTAVINEAPSNQIGFYDLIFGGSSAKVTFLPLGVTQSQLLAAANAQGANAGLGLNTALSAHNLDISAAGLFVRVYGVTLTKSGLIWSNKNQRVPALQWESGISISAGIGAKYYVGTSAPS